MSKSGNRELTDSELDATTGGMLTGTLGPALRRYSRSDYQGGHDAAQMFQQIMQQLTQG